MQTGARLDRGKYFPFETSRQVLDELREASRGGHADYYGITYERVDEHMGLFWPCPSLDHPGTPRLFEGGVSFHEDGKCRFQVTEWRESGDPVDENFLSISRQGASSANIFRVRKRGGFGGLVDIYPEPRLEIHPQLAARYRIADGDAVTITTRRAEITLPALVTKTIRPDTVFIPYHWAGKKSANQLTHRTLDPRSKIPEFKVSACTAAKASRRRSV